uniref:Integrase catalytic domain-containing protein n=1 Tax=Erpetoichthys calabaricus TaxID=27687 RepID=A0A8C4RS94_ERPCA
MWYQQKVLGWIQRKSWPLKDVWKHVRTCTICQQYKNPPGLPAGQLQSTNITEPGEMWGIDIMGPLPPSKNKRTVLVVVVDYYSKWVELFPLPNSTTERLCSILRNEMFTRWGVPKVIVSDRGPQFTSSEMESFMKEWGVTHKKTTAYHPQSNLTERVNRTLKTMIASYVGTRHQDWDQRLPELRMALNSAWHESTGESPACLALGRQILGPLEQLVTPPTPDSFQYCKVLQLENLKDMVKERLVHSKAKQARFYNKRRKKVTYSEGDRVWLRTHYISKASSRFTSKLAPKWFGPATILKQLGPVNYQVQWQTDSNMKTDTFHVTNMKPYYAPMEGLGRGTL